MALPALLGAGARAIGGQMLRSGGRAAASKILNRKDKKQRGIVKKENGGIQNEWFIFQRSCSRKSNS